MKQIIDYLQSNWEWIGPIVYELVVRLLPTKNSLSLINGIKNIADAAIPNNAKGGDKHE